MSALWLLLRADLKHHGRRLWLLVAGLVLATALFVMLCATGLGVRDGLLAQWGRDLPGDMVVVRPEVAQAGPLQWAVGGVLGQKQLSQAVVEDLQQLPHITAAYAVFDVALPMAAVGGASLFGKPLSTQIFASALPEGLIGPEFNDDPMAPIPVLLHESLVTLYNTTVAKSLGTPRMTSDALMGLTFDLVVGQSPLFSASQQATDAAHLMRLRARVVGTSPFALPLGISIPQSSAARMMRAYAQDEGIELPVSAILLRPDSAHALPAIEEEVLSLGLRVDDGARQVARMLQALVVLLGFLGALLLLLCAVAMVYAFGAYVDARRRELALMRVVGATAPFAGMLMLTEALLVGVASGLMGVFVAASCMRAISCFLMDALRRVPLLPEPLFVLPPSLMALGVLLAVTTALVGAVGPAYSVVREPLTRSTHPA